MTTTTSTAGGCTVVGSVAYDVAVYLGSFRNLDLLYRGLYIIQASLLVADSCDGQHVVAPVAGMSSCPSHLDSTVGDRYIPMCAVPIPCEIDDRSQCWRSRSLLIRYLDEQYELSDGIYWNLCVPGVTLNSDYICNGLDRLDLYLKFELLCCPLEQDDRYGAVPQRPSFSTVATQDLLIRRPVSGIHSYHPITFDGLFMAHVDCMVHIAITSLRFDDLIFESDMEEEVAASEESPCNESMRSPSCAQPSPSVYQRMMEVVRPPLWPGLDSSSGSDPLPAFMRRMNPNRSTIGSKYTNKDGSARSTPSPSIRAPLFDCAEGRLRWVHTYVELAVVNRRLFAAGIRVLTEAAAQKESMMIGGLVPLVDELMEDFLLQSSATTVLLSDVERASSAVATKMLLKAYMDRSNAILSSSWATLLANLRGTISMLAATMKDRHAYAARIFWREQAVARTVRLRGADMYDPSTDRLLLELLNGPVEDEVRTCDKVTVTSNAFRRELRVCDRLLEENMGKLPQLLIEQYTDEPASGDAQQSDLPQNGSATIQSLLKTLGFRAPQWAHRALGTEHSVRTGCLLDEHPIGWRDDTVTGPSLLDCSMSSSDEAAVRDDFICRLQSEVIGIDEDDAEGLVRSYLSRLSSVAMTRTTQSPFIANSGDSGSVAALHLVVLQHGFLGCGADMALLKNAIRTELPSHMKVFIPTSNEGKEGDSIAQMGARLAVELLDFCRTAAPSLLELSGQARVSFIGHSLGAVVIRWALQEPAILPLLRHVHAFISLASPHVGTLFPESQLVSVGMRALFQFKNYKSLQELVLEDGPEGQPSKSLLYRLSENGVLRHFKKVVLVSSPADRYVPSYSARVQKTTSWNSATGKVVSRMVDHVLEGLRPDQLVRITIGHICSLEAVPYRSVGTNSSVNDWIGRTAHICYLENAPVAKALVSNLSVFFS